jgi:uncharacterized membrane protein YdfJ with MMPL/SSD domain
MPGYVWVIIAIIILLIYIIHTFMKYKTSTLGTVDTFVTDAKGLIGAFEGTTDPNGSFTSRLGSFFGSMGS